MFILLDFDDFVHVFFGGRFCIFSLDVDTSLCWMFYGFV